MASKFILCTAKNETISTKRSFIFNGPVCCDHFLVNSNKNCWPTIAIICESEIISSGTRTHGKPAMFVIWAAGLRRLLSCIGSSWKLDRRM